MPSARRRALALTVSQDSSALMKIIDRAAMDPNFDVAKLEKLLEVRERWEAAEAKKAFHAAMAELKADIPAILKSKHVNIPGAARFTHATLADVCDAVIPALSKHGFSHKWEIEQKDRDIIVTCALTHQLGHQERTTCAARRTTRGRRTRSSRSPRR
jgi:hypothetical protein